MSFLSLECGALVLASAVVSRVVGRSRLPGVLILASAIFYVASAPGGFLWLALSVLLTYTVGIRMAKVSPRAATWRLTLTIIAIVGALVIVKLPGGAVAAPLGISYFSFRLMAYLLDVYWGRCPAALSPVAFVAFVTFFPQITSGPIDRWQHFLGQLNRGDHPAYERMASALRLILFGLFKKLVVANRLGALVDPAFDSPGNLSAPWLIAAAYAFPIELYADFSGLTDIARGISRLLGIEAPRNFDRPFLSSSVQEFWTRWHMSLTFWLRDYLFTPLSAALRHQKRIGTTIAVSVNMVAIGLWHGLRWTFLAFGVINAAYLVASAVRKRPGRPQAVSPKMGWRWWGSVVVTFNLMAFAFVFFRAADIAGALAVLNAFPAALSLTSHPYQAVAPSVSVSLRGLAAVVVAVVAMALVEFGVARGCWERWFMHPKAGTVVRWAAYYAVVLAIVFGGIFDNTEFIYARF